MADKKISQLSPALSAASADLLVLAQGGDNKKLTVKNLFGNINTPIGITQTPETITGGAVGLTTAITTVTTITEANLTLDNGYHGQMKTIVMTDWNGNATLIPDAPGGYEKIIFNSVGDTVTLIFLNSAWFVYAARGVQIVVDVSTVPPGSVPGNEDLFTQTDGIFTYLKDLKNTVNIFLVANKAGEYQYEEMLLSHNDLLTFETRYLYHTNTINQIVDYKTEIVGANVVVSSKVEVDTETVAVAYEIPQTFTEYGSITTVPTTIYTLPMNTAKCAKLIVQAFGTQNRVQCSHILLTHDNVSGYITEYAQMSSDDNQFVTLTVDVVGNNVVLKAASTTSGAVTVDVLSFANDETLDFTLANTNVTEVLSYPKAQYRVAKYVVYASRPSTTGQQSVDYQISEITLFHDGSTSFIVEHAVSHNTLNPFVAFASVASTNNISLTAQTNYGSAQLKLLGKKFAA